MVYEIALPSEIDICLKQYNPRALSFSVTLDSQAYDGTADTWRFRIVASDGTLLFNITETDMTLTYVASPAAMAVTIDSDDDYVHDEIIAGYYELRNVTKGIIHAEGRFEVRPSISEDI